MADTMTSGGVNKMVAMIAGAVLALVGILGFFNDPVLGLFDVNLLHNLIHLLTGAALLGAAFINHGAAARMTLLTLGVVYAIVTLAGFVAPDYMEGLLGDPAGPVSLMPDNILHLILAIVFIAVPLMVKEETVRPTGGRPQM